MGKKAIRKLLQKYDLIDERNIYCAGVIDDTNIIDEDVWGMRCLSVKEDKLLVINLGGSKGIRQVMKRLEKQDILKITNKPKLWCYETVLTLQTENFNETYCIIINRKAIKKIMQLFVN